jgi:hypothetical protein
MEADGHPEEVVHLTFSNEPIIETISIESRGVYLNLDREGRLVSMDFLDKTMMPPIETSGVF